MRRPLRYKLAMLPAKSGPSWGSDLGLGIEPPYCQARQSSRPRNGHRFRAVWPGRPYSLGVVPARAAGHPRAAGRCAYLAVFAFSLLFEGKPAVSCVLPPAIPQVGNLCSAKSDLYPCSCGEGVNVPEG